MLFEISSLGSQPDVGSAPDLLVAKHSPLTLTVQLGRSEALDSATLLLRRVDGAGLAGPSILLETSADGSTEAVEWIGAGWGDARRLHGLTLALPCAQARPRPRVLVDRGDGQWREPAQAPTVSALTTHGITRLHVSVDEVATRVRVMLVDAEGAPMTTLLDAADPLRLELSNEPEGLRVSVQGRRPLIEWTGPIPEEEGLALDDLLARLPANAWRAGSDGTHRLVLEIGAELAGDVELSWAWSTSARDDAVAAG